VLSHVAASVYRMTLRGRDYEVGVRELHDRLSEHLERVEGGSEIVVTRRGRPIARLSAVDGEDPLQDLVKRGLVTLPERKRSSRRALVKAGDSVSELVAEQRR
jgi:prevent-host-death family protein